MKNNRYLIGLILAIAVAGQASAFHQSFAGEPFVTILPAYYDGDFPVSFQLQHFYIDGKINSANAWLVGDYNKLVDVYAGGMIHGFKLISAGRRAEIENYEPELRVSVSPLKQEDNKMVDVSVNAGFSRMMFKQVFMGDKITFNDDYAEFGATVVRNFEDIALVNLSPTWIYETQGKKTMGGLQSGLKLMYGKYLALVGESAWLFTNPYKYATPWSYGLQFHVGPHTITAFSTNIYSGTLSNMMIGIKKMTFYGFRLSL